jgi:hypothetical protein
MQACSILSCILLLSFGSNNKIREGNMKKILVMIIAVLVLPSMLYAAEAVSTSNNNNANTINLIGPIQVPGEQNITYNTSPVLPATPFMDHPGYNQAMPNRGWNSLEGTTLPFILKATPDKEWVILGGVNWSNVKSKVERLSAEKYPSQKAAKVLNGDAGLKNIGYIIIASIVTYGDEATTMECFSEAIDQTLSSGGNVFLLLSANSTPGIWSRTIGLGGSSAGNFGMGGKDAFSAGMAIGYSSNKGHPIYQTFVQGVALWVDGQTYQKIGK